MTAVSNDGGRSRRVLKAVILGDGGVGKTSLMHRFVSNQFDPTTLHTVGVEFLKKTLEVDGQKVTLQIWDTAGQERFRSLRTPFYRGADVCMLTFALNDRESFENMQMWLQEFIAHADVPDAHQFPFILVGNKCDLTDMDKQVDKQDAELWCQEHPTAIVDRSTLKPMPYIETSAKTAVNVRDAFQTLLKAALAMSDRQDRRDFHDPRDQQTVKLANQPGQTRKCC